MEKKLYNKFTRRLAANGIFNFKLSNTAKLPSVRRPKVAGQHGGKRRAKVNKYGTQLFEIRKTQIFYDLTRRQLKTIFNASANLEEFICNLENRLLNVVFRCFTVSPWAARQLISHGKILINGKQVNLKNHAIKVGDIIEVDNKLLSNQSFLAGLKKKTQTPSFVSAEINTQKCKVKIVEKPSLNSSIFNHDCNINFQDVYEFLSYR